MPPNGLLFPISSKGSFIFTIPQTYSTYHGLCYTSHGALAGTRNVIKGVSVNDMLVAVKSYYNEAM